MENKEIVIIGGVAVGATAGARIRRLDENAKITIFERGEYVSFANCGLPYYLGEEIKNKDNLLLQTPEGFKRLYNISVKVQNEVIEIDKENKIVKVKNLITNEIYNKKYDKLILAMGAEPVKIFKDVYTVRNIPDIEEIKEKAQTSKSAIIIGAGYVGLEMAENLKNIGLDITIIERADQVIASIDTDMAGVIHSYLKEKDINLLLKTGVKTVENGVVTLEDSRSLKADIVISAIGVKPEVDIVRQAGIEIGELGGVKVNEYMQTSNQDIYAAGDMIEVNHLISGTKSLVPLASPANRQARIIADNICGIKSEYKNTQGTAIIRIFDKVIASTGAREKLLKENNIPYIKSYTHSLSNAGYYPGAKSMTIKLIFHKETHKILGAQIIGEKGIDKRIDVLATAVKFGLTPYDLTELELSYAPPFSSAKDPVNMAGYVATNIIDGITSVFYSEDVENINVNNDILIDVRSKYEYERNTITNAINIPIEQLRERINEIPKDKNIYLFCEIGLRSYLGARILTQNGFRNVKNLSGGYRLYKYTL